MPCGNSELSQKLVVEKSHQVPSGPSLGAWLVLFPQPTPSRFVQAGGACVGSGVLCSEPHSPLDSILLLVSTQPSAQSFYLMCCQKEVLGRNEKDFFSNWFMSSYVCQDELKPYQSSILDQSKKKIICKPEKF